jgi:hypothetical protein
MFSDVGTSSTAPRRLVATFINVRDMDPMVRSPEMRSLYVVRINSRWNLIVEPVAIERVRATNLIAPPAILNQRVERKDLVGAPRATHRQAGGYEVQTAAHSSDEPTPRKTPEEFLFLLTGNSHGADQFPRAYGALAAHLHESEEEAFLGTERPFHRCILFQATGPENR